MQDTFVIEETEKLLYAAVFDGVSSSLLCHCSMFVARNRTSDIGHQVMEAPSFHGTPRLSVMANS